MRTAKFEDFEELLFAWFKEVRKPIKFHLMERLLKIRRLESHRSGIMIDLKRMMAVYRNFFQNERTI